MKIASAGKKIPAIFFSKISIMFLCAAVCLTTAAVEAVAVAATRESVTCRNMKTTFILFLTFVVRFLQAKCAK